LKDRLQGSTKILSARISTVVATNSQILVDIGSDKVALKDVVVAFKSTSQIVATENGSPHEEPFEASFAPPDFGTSVTNQMTDTVGEFADNASASIGRAVDAAPDVEQNNNYFPRYFLFIPFVCFVLSFLNYCCFIIFYSYATCFNFINF
jgi:hypothetical protein